MLLGKESFINAVKKINEQLKNIPEEKSTLNFSSRIGHKKKLENPSEIDISIFAGDASKSIIDNFPISVKSSPMTISLCFNAKGEKEALIYSSLLKKIKKNFINENFELNYFSKYYFSYLIVEKANINIITEGNKVYMHFSVSGIEADVLNNLISSFDFSLINYTGLLNIIFSSEFNLMEIFNSQKSFNDILLDLLKFKIEIKGYSHKLEALAKVFVEFYKAFQNSGILTSDKLFLILLQFLRFIKDFGFSIEYDEVEFLNALLELDSILAGNKLKSFADNFYISYQKNIKAILEFIPEVIEDFVKDSLLENDFSLDSIISKSIDYENLELFISQPSPNLVLKIRANIKGANELIDDIFKIECT